MKKERQYLFCLVTRHNGEKFENPLMLSEARMISALARYHRKVEVELLTCTEEYYKSIFG